APAPAPVAVYLPTVRGSLVLPEPRAVQSNTLPYSPWLPILPAVLSATLPCEAILAWSPRSWRFLVLAHPGSERTPSALRSPDRSPPRSVESSANLEVGFYY